MDLFAFPPIAAVLGTAHSLLVGLADALVPIAGPAAAALAIVVVTLAVRAALIPLGVLQVRAETARHRLAPRIAELRRRHRRDPELLQRKTLELYRDAGISPFAGILPALAQVPIVSTLYAVAVATRIDGASNELLAETLLGAPLALSLPAVLTSTTPWPGALVPLALVVVMAVVAWFSRRQSLRMAPPMADGSLAGVARGMSWLSFGTVVVAVFVPLAAALYLAVSTTWTFAERTILRRRAGSVA